MCTHALVEGGKGDNKITNLRIVGTSFDEFLALMTIEIINFLFVEFPLLQEDLPFGLMM